MRCRAPLVHLLLAMLDPPAGVVSVAEVLHHVGITTAAVEQHLDQAFADEPRPLEPTRAAFSPRTQQLMAAGQGIALGQGASEPGDHHYLLALVYERHDDGASLVQYDVEPDEVYDELQLRGFVVPSARPRSAGHGSGPLGPRLYVRTDAMTGFYEALIADSETPGEERPRLRWGMNVSFWKPGWTYIDAEDRLDLASIANLHLDPADFEVVPEQEARAAESAARRSGPPA